MLFKGGISSPFRPWSFKLQKPVDIKEIPLNIMDGTLSDYLNLDYLSALEQGKKKIFLSSKFGRSLSLLWHNRSTYQYGIDNNYHPRLIRELIDYLKQLDSDNEF